jgi:CRP-like cAMP-binding protein
MIILENLKSSGYFNTISLKKWDVLFKQWDINQNLYLVYDGELSVQKEISLQKWEFKTLWLLGIGNIVWEAALSNNKPKEVKISANRETILLSIEWKKAFPKFVSAFPKDGYSLLITIIDIANTRLLKANSELTANYEVNIAISKIRDISMSSIYKLLLIFESIIWVDQIMYFEKNLVMDEYYKLRYDSKNKKCLRNTIIKFPNETLNFKILKEEKVEICKYKRYIKLSLWRESYWFILIGRDKKDFHENEEKLLINTAASFVAIIHQKRILDDKKNKNYVKSVL